MSSDSIIPTLEMSRQIDNNFSGDVTWGSTNKALFTSASAIYNNATDLIIDPKVSGTGQVNLNGGNLLCGVIGLGGSASSSAVLLNATGISGSTVAGGCNFDITYTGAGTLVGNFQAVLTYQGTAGTFDAKGAICVAVNNRASETSNVIATTYGIDALADCKATMVTLFYIYYGARARITDSGAGAHTVNTNRLFIYGFAVPAFPSFNAVAGKRVGVASEESMMITAGKRMYFEGTLAAGPGDTSEGYTTATTAWDLTVNGTKVLESTSTDIVATANLKLGTAGNGLYVKEGTNATMGTATLVAGTVVVNTTKVTANSRIFLEVNGGTLTNVGAVYVSARTAGTSFTITSLNILDASNVAWVLLEPS